MYLLSKLTGALTDLMTACRSGYPDGASNAAHAVSYVVHRLHNTRPPDCEMARRQWLLQGEPLLPLACRVLASLHKLRAHVGLSGLEYDPEWIERIVTQAVRYLDHLMGPPGDPGADVAALVPPTDGGGSAGRLCSCPGDVRPSHLTPVPSPSRN